MASLIRSIQEEVERKEQEEAVTRRKGRRSSPFVFAALGVAAVLNLYLLVAPPPWLFPPLAEIPSAVEEEMALRLTIYLHAQGVEQYRSENGGLPATLGEADLGGVDLRYRATGPATFEILGSTENVHIVYSSLQPAEDFLAGFESAFRERGS